MATKRTRGLGRGLDALLGADSASLMDLDSSKATLSDQPTSLPLTVLKAGKYQPRTNMDEESLNELAASIEAQGVMQPILVRPIKPKGAQKNKRVQQYEIIAGERRYRAAKLAKLKEVPVLVREVDDENAAVMALIENLQREDLNPLEEAQGVKRLLDEFGLTHEQAANAIGRSRSATSNMLRLLNLTDAVQTMLLAGDIDMGHARALLAVADAEQIIMANQIVAKRLSVRETEKMVAQFINQQQNPADTKNTNNVNQINGDAKRLEQLISDHLGTKVSLKMNAKNKGSIQIDFHDWNHLNSLLEKQGFGEILKEF